jgi:hypothetical protein
MSLNVTLCLAIAHHTLLQDRAIILDNHCTRRAPLASILAPERVHGARGQLARAGYLCNVSQW